jgi:hypothetical protein
METMDLRGRAVTVGDVTIGRVGDVVLGEERAMVGLVLLAISGREYFVHHTAIESAGEVVRIGSALHLIDDVGYYRRHGVMLSSLAPAS